MCDQNGRARAKMCDAIYTFGTCRKAVWIRTCDSNTRNGGND